MNRFLTCIVVLVCLAAAFCFYVTGPFGSGLESLPAWLGGGGDAATTNQRTYNLDSTGQYPIVIDAGTPTRICFTAPRSGTYRFTTSGTDDTVGTLYLSPDAMSHVAHSDDDNARAFQIDYQLSSGQTVYLDVSYWSSAGSGTVTLSVTCRTPAATSTPRATATPRVTATPRPTPTSTPRPQNVSTGNNAVSIRAGAATRVAFTAQRSGTYRFTTTGSDDTVGALYQSATASNPAIRSDDGNSRAFQIDWQLSSGQTVYLDVSYWSASQSGTVTLSITRLTQTATNTPRATATPRPTNTPAPQNVSTGYNTVSVRAGLATRLRFVAPSSGTYVFTTTGSRDTVGAIYASASSTTIVAQNDDYNGDRNFLITRSLSANEVVWLGVRFYGSSDSGTVQVRIYKQTSSGSSGTTSGTTSGRPSNWPVGETVTVYVSSGNTRTGPGMGYSWSGYVNRGYTFEVVERRLGDTGKDWYRIWHEGKYQWISSGLVEIDGYRNGTVNGVPIPND